MRAVRAIMPHLGLAGCLLWGFAGTAAASGFALEMAAASDAGYGKPHDIVLSKDGKALYVADNAKNRIVVLDAESLRELGSFANDEVSEPHDVAFDGQGRLLVADTGNSRIAIYQVDGSHGRLLGSIQGGMRRPEGVAVHPDGRVLATGASSGNIVAYRGDQIVGEAGGFSSPHDVEIDGAGSIWVADAGNDRMLRLDDDLNVIAELSGSPYDFSGPRYLDFDAKGRMYVADKYTHSIKVISPTGDLLYVLGGPDSGLGKGVFDRPEGVEIRGQDIWFSDTYNNRIVRYRMVGP